MSNPARRRARLHHPRRHAPPGAPPGSVIIHPDAPRPVITAIAYGPDRFVEKTIAAPSELRELRTHYPVVWVNVDGLGDADTTAWYHGAGARLRTVGHVRAPHSLGFLCQVQRLRSQRVLLGVPPHYR